MKSKPPYHNIIVFNGVCNFCNGAVSFIVKRDSNGVFRFTSSQSETGRRLMEVNGFDPELIDTFLLIRSQNIFVKSDAALTIAKELDFPWNRLVFLKIAPKFLRDWSHSAIARNRYRWFGKRDQCMLPTPEQKARFIP